MKKPKIADGRPAAASPFDTPGDPSPLEELDARLFEAAHGLEPGSVPAQARWGWEEAVEEAPRGPVHAKRCAVQFLRATLAGLVASDSVSTGKHSMSELLDAAVDRVASGFSKSPISSGSNASFPAPFRHAGNR